MDDIKSCRVKIKKLERENKKQKEKIGSLKGDLSKVRKERNYLRKRNKALEFSRDSWKEKNKANQLEKKQLKAKLDQSEKVKWHHYPKSLISLCLLLRIKAGCSYGSIVKILQILIFCFHLDLQRVPCENSLQNWVSKLGLYVLEKADKGLRGKQVSLIVDESIRMGKEKQLLLLVVPLKKEKNSALQFEDVEVLHVEGSTSWTGEKIAKVLEALQVKHGYIVHNVLSDEASNLKKASRLSEVLHLPEITHAVATCLKKSFKEDEKYKAFTSLIGSYKQKGVNQGLSYLCPPKQRSKARFMNQRSITKWATKLLGRFSNLNKEEKEFFGQLEEHQAVIQELDTCLASAKAVSLPFKNKGLCSKTLKAAEQHIKLQEKELEGTQRKLTSTFLTHLKGYLSQYKTFLSSITKQAIHISTEVIESLFGKHKSKAHKHSLIGLTKLNLEIPLYCMSQEELTQIIPVALENISMTYLEQWIEKHSSENQLVKRTKFFK